MTDDPHPEGTKRPDAADSDTLAVHAVLDGEAGADERRRVASDPALLALLAEARAARDAVATTPPPPSDDVLAAVRTRALDAALETDGRADATAIIETGDGGEPADDAPTDPHEDAHAAAVGSLSDARTARETRARRRLPPLPAVAAVVILLVLVGVGLLVTDGDGDGEQTAADSAAETADDELSASAQADDDEDENDTGGDTGERDDGSGDAVRDPAPSDEASPDVAAVIDDLLVLAIAAYPSPDALLEELRTVDPSTLTLPVEGSPTGRALDGAGVGPDDAQIARCDVINSNQEGLEPATAAAVVAVEETPLVVTANHDPSTDGTRLTVMELPSCIPLGGVAR